ncbi:Uncharacterised protein [Mycobacterium tuberculosis]|nr:Uncharacterised protein [Mycobacterium tuberculosis]
MRFGRFSAGYKHILLVLELAEFILHLGKLAAQTVGIGFGRFELPLHFVMALLVLFLILKRAAGQILITALQSFKRLFFPLLNHL